MTKIKSILLISIIFPILLFGVKSNTIDIKKIDEVESKTSMEKWLKSDFGLQPYKVNYILPFGVSSYQYKSYMQDLQYKDIEAELQVSLKLKLFKNIFGLNETYYLSYTQQAFWQIYIDSSPFRESIYNPEGFVIFPIQHKNAYFKFRSLKFCMAHKSNGQPNTTEMSNGKFNLSKSINYLYLTARFQHKTIIADFTAQAPFPGKENLSDNEDIMKYMGYTKAKLTYFYKSHMFTLMLQGNLASLKGSVEGTYSYPLKYNTNFYVKIHSGYMESLIDYNHDITKISIGFSFSR